MWAHDLLGLPVDADERAVKRAYAARLKVTRPDDDPAAFQRLVEARDVALQWARNGWGRPDPDPDPDPDDDDGDAIEAMETAAASDPGLTPPAEPVSHGRVAGPPLAATEDDRLPVADREGARPAAADREADGPDSRRMPEAEGTLISRLGDDVDPPLPEPSRLEDRIDTIVLRMAEAESSAPPPEPSRAVPEPAAPPEPAGRDRDPDGDDDPEPEFDPEPDTSADRFAALTAEADRLLNDPWFGQGGGHALAWEALIGAAEDLDIAQRLAFETQLARGFDRHLGRGRNSGDAAPVLPERTRVLLRLASEAFGWDRDVRRLARIVGGASEVGPLVATIEALTGPPPTPRRDETGFPLLEPFDLEAFLGSLNHPLVRYYRRAQRAGRLVLSFSPLAFFLPVWWAGRNRYMLWAAGLSVLLAVAMSMAVDPRHPGGNGPLFIGLVAVILAGRTLLAANAQRLEILNVTDLIEKADREAPARNDKRKTFLAARRPTWRLVTVLFSAVYLVMVDIFIVAMLIDAAVLSEPRIERLMPEADPARLDTRLGAVLWREHRERSIANVVRVLKELGTKANSPADHAAIEALRADLRTVYPEGWHPDYPARSADFERRLEAVRTSLGRGTN
ncbi:J domain-containing protein [Prosthecomicrobium hirschii]|uniref:J domain-containing protein n=1 Tax=Prosthecodimorpha hirschii TaxID=665126 RepID=UPI00221FAFB7|nr:J domain-containing protein [Prosthecomicrobium hirschii]MCW1840905.1 J domain-containing protein [Prosthecomicrobium hirschii]